ncbi:uncharacterized protein PHACADRAFT_263840 [Phanerochaete carnosa HHB-10118-sp]|uniref:Uncharacterized protein n=1 Tax=Phanerochaete carnosa (strain HHB-10118-sp) TaxID=650164 RepID=K5ULG9_PHACS|nr:uncharacterized protein PHACADRAFT_263840 [Phanerochaete carnosa HHB-10118-sp]EKM50511.1 hypothetical protein PHACADRAFT_263840 [Phanerochaete carnosa HHB-10118-sp]
MVVTRRAPPAPVPTSRTNSAQPIPRVKARVPPTSAPDASSPLANGGSEADTDDLPASNMLETALLDSSSKKGNGSSKRKLKKGKHSRRKSTSFVELLTRVFLLWFTIYTLSVCPNDESLKSPLCRGLYHYRKLVLEPFLLPPIQLALAHPSVAPYVQRSKPYIDRTIAVVKPIALRTQSEWNNRVAPQWKKRVVPQWNRHVIPQYIQHVQPYVTKVEQQVAPYVSRFQTEYGTKVDPYVRATVISLHRWQQQARPYVVLAAHKTYDGYLRAKPYAVPIIRQIQLLLLQFARFLGEQRRQFVDPHIKTIWERVNELGNGDATERSQARSSISASFSEAAASVSSSVRPAAQTSSSFIPAASEAVVGSAVSVLPDILLESESPTAIPITNPVAALTDAVPSASGVFSSTSIAAEHAMSTVSSMMEDLASSTSSIGSPASSVLSTGSSLFLDEALPTASSIAVESIVDPVLSLAARVESSTFSLNDEASSAVSYASASAVSVAPEALSTASSVIRAVSETILSAASTIATPAAIDDDDDLDFAKLFADLGLEEDFLQSDHKASGTASTAPAAETESEEEKAEKLRLRSQQNRKTRADITARHTEWEVQLEERIVLNRKALRQALVAIRKAATAELKETDEIRNEIEGLVGETEKYLRGAEKYLSNLRGESRTVEEKKTIWEKVVEKVDGKFTERLTQTEAVVNGWYLRVAEKELAEVRRLAGEVKDITDRAQADIGLDYAWLEDVTYRDWQRYHALERKSQEFLQHAMSVQNGSHPSPPINPVLVAIEDLQNEVEDVVVGFETRLRRIKRSGERAFGGAPEESESEVRDDHDDETVSILPIEDESYKRMEDEEPVAAPPVVIGRGAEEVMSALDRAAEIEAHATSVPEEESENPEQVVEALAQEAAADDVLSSRYYPEHTEL